MSDAVYAAIVGTIVGGMISAIVAFLVAKQQIKAARKDAREQIEEARKDIREQIEANLREGRTNRTWKIAFTASQVQSEILSAYTPDNLTKLDDLYKLQNNWGKQSRQLHILGEKEIANQLSKILNEYFGALREFIEHKMQRGELEHRRQEAKDAVAEIMSKFR